MTDLLPHGKGLLMVVLPYGICAHEFGDGIFSAGGAYRRSPDHMTCFLPLLAPRVLQRFFLLPPPAPPLKTGNVDHRKLAEQNISDQIILFKPCRTLILTLNSQFAKALFAAQD